MMLLEGIITEALGNFGVFGKDHKGKFAMRAPSIKPLNLYGLHAKLPAGIHLSEKLRDHFTLIRDKQFSSENPCRHLAATRNDILHGTAFGYNTEKNSVLLLLWIATTIITIKKELNVLALKDQNHITQLEVVVAPFNAQFCLLPAAHHGSTADSAYGPYPRQVLYPVVDHYTAHHQAGSPGSKQTGRELRHADDIP